MVAELESVIPLFERTAWTSVRSLLLRSDVTVLTVYCPTPSSGVEMLGLEEQNRVPVGIACSITR